MPVQSSLPWWKEAPFIRLLLPLITGILLQWYAPQPLPVVVIVIVPCLLLLLLSGLLPVVYRYRWRRLQGVVIQILIAGMGLLLVQQKDIRNHTRWIGHLYQPGDRILAEVAEPPLAKNRSFKSEMNTIALVRNGQLVPCCGRVLAYIAKDSATAHTRYGDRLLLNAALQPIGNSGNPGAFDYQQYSAFHGLHHTVFLRQDNYILLDSLHGSNFRGGIYKARDGVLNILRRYMTSSKDELGIAEALLIGYTQDLDKDLVQAYSNTGVVHVIAVSGMHLGLIYILLLAVFKRLPYIKRAKWLQLLLALVVLWLFALLTGASASVLRAAVMFTCIGTGKLLMKQAPVYNALAASAFILLCYDPFYLWDVGFRLSYLAVLGILLFQQPVLHLLYVPNKWLRKIWELTAVSLSAQIFTFPVCIWYFHQFPNLFLFSNLLVVPLSGFILYAEILLLLLAWSPALAGPAGWFCSLLTQGMNRFVQWLNQLSFSVWDNIPATPVSTLLLYASVISLSAAVLQKKKKWITVSLFFFAGFCAAHAVYRWQTARQRKLIVYQVPRYRAVDFVEGNRYYFRGDTLLQQEGLLQQFHLRPARIDLQAKASGEGLPSLYRYGRFYSFAGKRILLLDTLLPWRPPAERITIDVVIISGNPRLRLDQLAAVFHCGLIVADASNSKRSTGKWQQQAKSLQLSFYDVYEQGAWEYKDW